MQKKGNNLYFFLLRHGTTSVLLAPRIIRLSIASISCVSKMKRKERRREGEREGRDGYKSNQRWD